MIFKDKLFKCLNVLIVVVVSCSPEWYLSYFFQVLSDWWNVY